MTEDPRSRWNAAVERQREMAAALDARDTLVPVYSGDSMRFTNEFNRAIEELADAREALLGTPHAVTHLEWVVAYQVHRNAMFRWNKRHVLDMAKRDVEDAREDIAALYARIVSGRLFDIAAPKG